MSLLLRAAFGQDEGWLVAFHIVAVRGRPQARRMDLPVPILLFAAATFGLAGFVKGVIGLGLPTISMGLLSMALPPATAAALLIVPSLVTNVWQMLAGPPPVPLVRRLWPMLAGVCAGTLTGAGWLGAGEGRATVGLGLALVVYAVFGLTAAQVAVPAGAERWLGPIVGVVTGLVTAATGVFVIPAVPYLQALGMEKDDLVQALGLSFTVSTLALAVGLAGDHVGGQGTAVLSLVALVPAAIGMLAGQWLRARASASVFRMAFFAGLLLLGLHLALRPLW
jgi:uncharacterized membrane protein YfcA